MAQNRLDPMPLNASPIPNPQSPIPNPQSSPIVPWPGSLTNSGSDPHQLVAFGQKYPAPQEWNKLGFPIDFFVHCWTTLSHKFANGHPSEHKIRDPQGMDLCHTPNTPSNITLPADHGRSWPIGDWDLWHLVEYQTVQRSFQTIQTGKGKLGSTRDKPKYHPRRWFARCRGRNDFLANVYHHLNGLFEKIRVGKEPDPGPDSFEFIPIKLDLTEYLADQKMKGWIPDQEAVLGAIGLLWDKQDKQAEEIQSWASEWCTRLGVRQCQTMDAVFLNGVSALLTVYTSHAVLYEKIEMPTNEGFRELHCNLKTVQEQEAHLDIHPRKKLKCNGLVGPVIVRGEDKPSEPYEPDEPELQVFSL